MSVVSRIEHLQAKHSELKAMIAAEMARPLPSFDLITDMKKQKLSLKEEISRLLQTMDEPQKNAS